MALAITGMAVKADSSNRWLFYPGFCLTEEDLATSRSVVDKAAAVGMNGMIIKGVDGLVWQNERQRVCLRRLGEYGREKGVSVIPQCWSVGLGTMTWHYPDLVETTPVRDMAFKVSGNTIVSAKEPVAIANSELREYDLEKNTFAHWWNEKPGLVSFVDVAGGHDGKPAVRFEPSPEKNSDRHSRLYQEVRLKPNRCYRVAAWVRGVDVQMNFHPIQLWVNARRADGTNPRVAVRGLSLEREDCSWHRLSVDFMTAAMGCAQLTIGSWNAQSGKIWISDITLEEIGITELSRRKGAPRTLRNADTGIIYTEGRDWTLADTKNGEEIFFNRPEGSAIRPGDRLFFDCFVTSRGGNKFGCSTCMSDPRLAECFVKSARAIEDTLHPDAWLLSVDEVWNGGTCELCRARKESMAQIYGACLTQMRDAIRAVSPNSEIYAWSDMLDPNHNAREGIGACASSFEGSIDFVPKDLNLMLWYGDALEKSAPFFAERGRKFMGSVCCDGRDSGKTIRHWKDALSPYPELRGFMYTTWIKDYTKVDEFMKGLE